VSRRLYLAQRLAQTLAERDTARRERDEALEALHALRSELLASRLLDVIAPIRTLDAGNQAPSRPDYLPDSAIPPAKVPTSAPTAPC
jgi:hypothetical protein